jgi:hypothetical protein
MAEFGSGRFHAGIAPMGELEDYRVTLQEEESD